MLAHIKAALLPVSRTIQLADGVPLLGTWQGSVCSNTATPRIVGALPPIRGGDRAALPGAITFPGIARPV